MTKRRAMTETRKARIFTAAEGVCHICGLKIDGTRERWEAEHVIPMEMGGDDDDGPNVRPAHVACHKVKTAEDLKQIAKSKRMQRRYAMGIPKTVKRPFPGGRNSNQKRKITGEVVPRRPK